MNVVAYVQLNDLPSKEMVLTLASLSTPEIQTPNSCFKVCPNGLPIGLKTPKWEENFNSSAMDRACEPLAIFRQFHLHRIHPPFLDALVRHMKQPWVGPKSHAQHMYMCDGLNSKDLMLTIP